MKSALKYIVFALMALMPLSQIDAKGSSSSSSSRSSSSSSSRSSFSSSPRTSTPSVTKPKSFSSSSSKPSAVQPKTSTAPKNAFDKSQAARSVAPPTPPKPKSDYVADFKKNNVDKYPTKFTTPPATRPSYIPPTTTYNGQSREVVYNQSAGGYGFMDTLGQFMLYDAITDIATASFQKDQVVYVQQAKEHEAAVKQAAVAKDEGWSAFEIFLLIIGLGFVGVVLFYFFGNDNF